PRFGMETTSPCCSSRPMASRIGLRETPRRAARSASTSLLPGTRRPPRMSRRMAWKASARRVVALSWGVSRPPTAPIMLYTGAQCGDGSARRPGCQAIAPRPPGCYAWSAPVAAMDNAHALVVGIAHYQHLRSLPPTVVKDAHDVHDLLVDPTAAAYPPAQVTLLMDDQASLAGLR